jgi:hypothetical protein
MTRGLVIGLFISSIVFCIFLVYSQQGKRVVVIKENPFSDILSSILIDDLIAMVFWDKETSENLMQEIKNEQKNGVRDKVLFD